MKSPSTSAALTHEAGRQHLMLMMNEHLSEFSEYVRHALAARDAAGDLTPGELTTEDVVDDVRVAREYFAPTASSRESPRGSRWATGCASWRRSGSDRRSGGVDGSEST